MGRWGYRLFEGDMDVDLACSLLDDLGMDTTAWDHTPAQTVNQTDMLAPPEARERYKTKTYAKELQEEIVPYVRAKFDTDNLGQRLMAASRAQEDKDHSHSLTTGEYKTIALGPLLMRVGAVIKDDDLQHLRNLVPKVTCVPGTALPFGDDGFRSPGRAQFLAALDAYDPGKPRSFQELSCFNCGKIEAEIGSKPLECSKSKRGYYCNKDCQRAHWRAHKPVCIAPKDRFWKNV